MGIWTPTKTYALITTASLVIPIPGFAAFPAATPIDRAEQALRDGNYLKAAQLAEEIGSPDGFSMAARALLAEVERDLYADHHRKIVLRAERLARAAISVEPRHPEANLQLAAALGMKSRYMAPVQAHFAGLAKEARLLIDRTLETDPNNAWAHALDGAWHLELVGRAGAKWAQELYGADATRGMLAYERALSRADEPSVIAYHFGLALLDATPQKAAYAETLLRQSYATPDPSALSGLSRERAGELLVAIGEKDRREVNTLVKRLKGLTRATETRSRERG